MTASVWPRSHVGEFVNETTVFLKSGQRIVGVKRHSTDDGYSAGYCSGWTAGALYVSRDGGATWQASDLMFRCG